MYSRVLVCEIRKIEVYYIDFSRPSPALRDDSWNEDEPVSGVRIDASPGKPDFFDASPGTSRTASSPWLVIVIDEFSCARRQDVLTAAPARYA